MTQAQKVIKYFAYALAIFIIISIFYLVIEVVKVICGIYEDNDINLREINYNNYLELDVSGVDLYIENGDLLKAESDSKKISVKQDGNKLVIKEKNSVLFNKNKTVIKLTVPKDLEFDYVKIDTGEGNLNIDSLATKNLDIDMGAGSLKVNSLIVSNDADIDGGVGDINLNDVRISDLNLNLGAGLTIISGNIFGSADIDTGVGNFTLNLKDKSDMFTFDVSKGIGSILINDEKINNDRVIGNGIIKIEIDGGVGNIEINTRY